MKVIPKYGRFPLRDVSVTSLSMRMPGAFARFRDVVRRCGYRYWFSETAEAVPPPDKTLWWQKFERELVALEELAAARTKLTPSAQLRLYYAGIQEAFETHLGFESSWQIDVRTSPELSSIGFFGVSEQPFCDSTTAYCELALELHVTSSGWTRLKFTPPTWIHGYAKALRFCAWPGGRGFRELTWRMPDGTRGDLETLLGHGDKLSADRSTPGRKADFRRMSAIHPMLAELRMPG